jgi:hypothetical protein
MIAAGTVDVGDLGIHTRTHTYRSYDPDQCPYDLSVVHADGALAIVLASVDYGVNHVLLYVLGPNGPGWTAGFEP